MKDIAIYGAGGLGDEVYCLIKQINNNNGNWNFIGFFDDNLFNKDSKTQKQIIGDINVLNKWDSELNIVIAIGTPNTVYSIVSSITNKNVLFPNLFSPDIIIMDKNLTSFGKGNIICSFCIISCNTIIGDFNLVNFSSIIAHNSRIGNYNSIMPDVKISGNVTIGDMNFFGTSSVILQNISIGNNTKIGANSLVTLNTKDNNTYIGNPARVFNF